MLRLPRLLLSLDADSDSKIECTSVIDSYSRLDGSELQTISLLLSSTGADSTVEHDAAVNPEC